jgi:hypothetical protein
MSDRKYRQRGYQDEPRRDQPRGERPRPEGPRDVRPRSPVAPREPRAPNLPDVRRAAKCAQCGALVELPIFSLSRCARCNAELRSCAQCVSFDPAAHLECRKPIPARVSPKHAANECPFFEPRTMIERETRSPGTPSGPPDARKAFDDLFK